MKIDISKYIPENFAENGLMALIVLVVGGLLVHFTGLVVTKLFLKKQSKQNQMIVRRFIVYSGAVFVLFVVFKILGLKLGTLFGAAGVVGIVIGVASQTSIGNIVSGIFLVTERSFELGDLVRVGDKLGVVYSIDLLSIKLKTLDNLLVRIPNQTIISTELVNITRFPIRRMDFVVSVAYKEDLAKVEALLREVASKNKLCLDEPEPLVLIKDFGESSIDFQIGLWFEKTQYLNLRNSIFKEIKNAFDENNIEIPFPHISLYAGEATKPFSVNISDERK